MLTPSRSNDLVLIGVIKTGRSSAAPVGYTSDMPAFADRFDDREIGAILDFIKAQWPPGVRAYQAALNPGGSVADVPGDWSFPVTCRTPGR